MEQVKQEKHNGSAAADDSDDEVTILPTPVKVFQVITLNDSGNNSSEDEAVEEPVGKPSSAKYVELNNFKISLLIHTQLS